MLVTTVLVMMSAGYAYSMTQDDANDAPTPKAFAAEFTSYTGDDLYLDVPTLETIDAQPAGGGNALTITVKTPSTDSGAVLEAQWEAWMSQGAVAESYVASGARDLHEGVTSSTIDVEMPDGTIDTVGGGQGSVVPGAIFPAQINRLNDQEIASSIEASLEPFPLTNVSIDVVHAIGPAPVVTATVDDVSSLRDDLSALKYAIIGNPAEYEGYFLWLRSPNGHLVLATGAAYRAGADLLAFAPGVDTVMGAVHMGVEAPDPEADPQDTRPH